MRRQDVLILVAGGAVILVGLVLSLFMKGKGTLSISTPGATLQMRGGWMTQAKVTSGSPVEVRAGIYHPVQANLRL